MNALRPAGVSSFAAKSPADRPADRLTDRSGQSQPTDFNSPIENPRRLLLCSERGAAACARPSAEAVNLIFARDAPMTGNSS